MGNTRANTGGKKLWHEGERVSYGDLNRVSDIQERSLLHLMAEIFRVVDDGVPQSGVFGDSFDGTNPSGLDIEIDAGLGLYYDISETDDWSTHYKPASVDVAETKTLSAHHASLVRVDRISIEPGWDDDTPETDNIRDPSTGTVTSQSKSQRRLWGGTVTVTEGTAGAGAPSWPAGHIPLWTVSVPAVSGAPTLTDARVKLLIAKTMLDLQTVYIETSAAAQVGSGAGSYRDVTVQVKDLATGEDVESAATLLVEAFNWEFLTVVADITWGLAPASGGSIQFGNGKARGALTTDSDGAVTIRITQVSGNLGALLRLAPEGQAATSRHGPTSHTELAFT